MLKQLLGAMLLTALAMLPQATASAAAPNILLIMADDMGYGDLSCLGSEQIHSLEIDKLAATGVLCTQAYVTSSVCSPSRAGLITGRDPRRFGYEGNLNSAADNYAARPELLGLPVQEHTLADQLKPLGYATALIGKWHLGSAEQFHPNRRGFDYFCGMIGGSHQYFPTAEKNKLERKGRRLREFSSPYLTDFFTDEAVAWISAHGKQETKQPWFLYLSYNAPHTPMQATKADLEACQFITDKKRRTYAAMMRALDRGVGRVVASLEKTGQRENTLLVFFSDNGGATNNGSWNGPLSGAKGSCREGGVRVPMIWNWPGRFAPRKLDSAAVSSLDLLPTFLAAAHGKPLPPNKPPAYHDKRNERRGRKKYGDYDGINLLPLLEGQGEAPPRTLFWRLQGQASIRQGEYKLIRLSHRPAQLFQPASDLGEQTDLATTSPAALKKLYAELGAWEAMLPTVPIWGSSPYWQGESAEIYDTWAPRPEPK